MRTVGRRGSSCAAGFEQLHLVWLELHYTAYLVVPCDDEPASRSNDVTSVTHQQLDIIPRLLTASAAAAKRPRSREAIFGDKNTSLALCVNLSHSKRTVPVRVSLLCSSRLPLPRSEALSNEAQHASCSSRSEAHAQHANMPTCQHAARHSYGSRLLRGWVGSRHSVSSLGHGPHSPRRPLPPLAQKTMMIRAFVVSLLASLSSGLIVTTRRPVVQRRGSFKMIYGARNPTGPHAGNPVQVSRPLAKVDSCCLRDTPAVSRFPQPNYRAVYQPPPPPPPRHHHHHAGPMAHRCGKRAGRRRAGRRSET